MRKYNFILLRKTFPISILLLISCWPLYLYIFTGKTILTSSSLHHYPPLLYNAVQTMFEGHLPLWNPYILTGIPLLGDGVSNPFNILNIALIFFKPPIGFTVLASLQLFLSGLFMYIYLRRSLLFQRLSCLFGGILTIFNPVLIFGGGQRLDFIDPPGSFLWLPLIMLFIDQAVKNTSYHSYYYSILSGLIVSLALFGGNTNIVFFMACFLVVYIFLQRIPFTKKIVIIGCMGIISLLVTSVQLLPLVEFVKDSHRTLLWEPSNYDFTGLGLFSAFISPLEYPINLVLGFVQISWLKAFSDIPHRTIFIGLLDLYLLGLVYLAKTDNYKISILKINAVLILLFQMGIYYLPIRGILLQISPLFKGVHLAHFTFLFYFSIIVLLTFTFETLFFRDNLQPKTRKYVYYGGKSISILSLLIILSLFVISLPPLVWFQREGGLVLSISNIRPLRLLLYVVLLYFASHVIYKTVTANRGKKVLLGYLFFALTIFNLLLLWEYNFLRILTDDSFHKHFMETKLTSFLNHIKPTERLESLYGKWDWTALIRSQYFGFNLPTFYKASVAGGSHQHHSARYRKFYDMINSRYPFDPSYYWKGGRYVKVTGRVNLDNQPIDFKSLDLLGVKYVFSPREQKESFLKLILTHDWCYVYENLNVLNRSFIVYDFEIMNEEQILDALYRKSFNPLDKVLLEKHINVKNQHLKSVLTGVSNSPRCAIVNYTPNEVLIKYFSFQDGILVLTDAYDKGWKAYVDGNEVEIFRADYLFRAILVPKGDHIVRFKYLPLSFLIGSGLSIITIIFSFMFLLYSRKRFQTL